MTMKSNFAALLFLLLCAGCATQSSAPQKASGASQKFSGATPLEWSQRLADSEMARLGDTLVWKPDGKAKWDYAAGLFTLSLLKLSEAVGQGQRLRLITSAPTAAYPEQILRLLKLAATWNLRRLPLVRSSPKTGKSKPTTGMNSNSIP